MKLIVCTVSAWLMAVAVIFSFKAVLVAIPMTEYAEWAVPVAVSGGVMVVAFVLDRLTDGGQEMKLLACMFLALLMLVALLTNTPPAPLEWREAASVGYAVLTIAVAFTLNWLSD